MGGERSGRPASVTAGQSLPGEGVSPGWHQRPYEAVELAEFEVSTHHRHRVVLAVAVALLVAIGFLAARAWPEEPNDCMAPPLAAARRLPHVVADSQMTVLRGQVQPSVRPGPGDQ